jgi:hypothetical protein
MRTEKVRRRSSNDCSKLVPSEQGRGNMKFRELRRVLNLRLKIGDKTRWRDQNEIIYIREYEVLGQVWRR